MCNIIEYKSKATLKFVNKACDLFSIIDVYVLNLG